MVIDYLMFALWSIGCVWVGYGLAAMMFMAGEESRRREVEEASLVNKSESVQEVNSDD